MGPQPGGSIPNLIKNTQENSPPHCFRPLTAPHHRLSHHSPFGKNIHRRSANTFTAVRQKNSPPFGKNIHRRLANTFTAVRQKHPPPFGETFIPVRQTHSPPLGKHFHRRSAKTFIAVRQAHSPPSSKHTLRRSPNTAADIWHIPSGLQQRLLRFGHTAISPRQTPYEPLKEKRILYKD